MQKRPNTKTKSKQTNNIKIYALSNLSKSKIPKIVDMTHRIFSAT